MKNTVMTAIAINAIALTASPDVSASDSTYQSFHIGIMHPSGVDLIGYTAEKRFSSSVYSYYTFGFPSLAAIGFNYYSSYSESGLNTTIGIGVGSVLYGSVAYQIALKHRVYFKIGAGVTTSIVYTGAYPVLALENRF